MLYNIVLVSAVQKRESAISVYIYIYISSLLNLQAHANFQPFILLEITESLKEIWLMWILPTWYLSY